MPARGRGKNRRGRNQSAAPSGPREAAYSLSGDSPILAVFLQAARKLTDRQDRHERLVKMSRDITIESKRIIFLLHAAITEEKSKEAIIAEAKQRIETLTKGPIRAIAVELENVPAHLHSRAVTAGLQEFVEARTLLSLMENKQIIKFPAVQKELTYIVKSEDSEDRQIATLLPHMDYMLGLADLSGELMRKAINSISGGDKEDCFFACEVLRHLFAGFLGLFGAGPLLTAKLSTTRANVFKAEYAVYTLSVRGNEAPPQLLLPAAHNTWEQPTASENDGDEGFY